MTISATLPTAASPAAGIQEKGSIELRRVRKTYGDVAAVDDLDLTVQPGEFVTLLGPSGSGKTTTMMMVAGFEELTSGTVLINGEPVDKLPPKDRNLGVVFQSYALFPHMSARENVEFALRMRKIRPAERRRRAEEALERVGLANMGDRRPSQLSGGQQQRVALARALVFNPSALLLDEPMAALDKRLREQMQEEIKTIQRSLGISVLFVTHDQDEAMSMSDRIVVMRDGRIVQQGAPEDVYAHPATDWVANFLGDTNLLPCSIVERSGDTAVVDLGRLGICRVQNRGAEGDRYAVSIRPEHLTFIPAERDENCAKGRVVSSTNLGATIRHRLLVGEQELLMREMSPSSRTAAELGADVCVGWDQDHAQLLVLDA
ncbi:MULTISPECIES: ABC transporter ATP-binding protein [unclassified Streptomyces]|uniref:ABC transporter ATP-binding protein n=1 Tax=unclassified Streptomyces TaxID=2593676 RepID=UPI002DD94581|nr:ABC transporter ATP-binding protein [Streptomyces sp. NBC_01750]WSB04471.1 ABC transporter ATP-binding protein [Streptomyces sp. NBC_01794]WSD31247.1 ABC transporter ATP-binding protein [Streptomyces sp. NBC_01750]